MSSGLDLRVTRSLALLASLQQTGRGFAAKEETLRRELRDRRYSASKKTRDAVEKLDTRLAAQTADVDARAKSELARLAAKYAGRRERVERYRTAGIRNLPKRAREAKQRWMGDLQMKHFFAERRLTAGKEAAAADYAAFAAKLAEQRAAFVTLERRARKSFAGYWTHRRMLRRKRTGAAAPPTVDRDRSFEDFQAHLHTAGEMLDAFREFLLPRIFMYVQLPAVIGLLVLAALALGFFLGGASIAGIAVEVFLVAVCAVHYLGARQSRAAATALATALAEAGRSHDAASAAAEAQRERERQRLNDEHDRAAAEIQAQWDRADSIEAEFEKAAREKLETQTPRVLEKIEKFGPPKLARIETDRANRVGELTTETKVRRQQLTQSHAIETTTFEENEAAEWATLAAEWKREIVPLYKALGAMNDALDARFPPWDARFVETWTPPTEFTAATRFAHIDLDLTPAIPHDPRLPLPGPAQVSVPLALAFPAQGSLLFETRESVGASVIGALNNIILRQLSTTPPGKLAFTIIDPVGLGQNFAGLMHLADYEESLVNRRIWTQRDQIEERLADLNEHIEKVIQMYLRNEYATISEYNEKAGSVAEKYHFLVVADFPANFSDVAAKRLQSIAISGPRCGIFTLIHWDQRLPLPDGFLPDELRQNSVCIHRDGERFVIKNERAESGTPLALDPPPDPALAVKLVHKIGQNSIDSNRVEVPFEQIAPRPAEYWTNDTTNELKIAVGRTGATKLQYLAIGKGTRQHALFAGKTGSGKSTLFHVIITNLALACSPEQVEFYLIDFKKGVEFKCYATKRLPHARVVAIESDREFALSVLQRLDEELKRRGDIFRKLGVQDLAGYKRTGGVEPMPRSLLLIDEFQEFFVDDDAVAQTASLLFDRIVRQGRAFGIHVLLGSQTLGGAYSLARATLGQMAIRVALQCNEADAYLIMDDSNSAPRLLSRPGEGIYNDASGASEGNSPFQVVWLPDDERDEWLDKVHALAVQHGDRHASPIVFEGNAPADIRENDALRTVLDTAPVAAPGAARCWLGAPNSIKGPTEAVFRRQSGNHLLIVGQRDEAALSIVGLSMLALAAQYPLGTAKFFLMHSANAGAETDFIESVVRAIPHGVSVARGQEVAAAMNEISAEMKARVAGERTADAPAVFVFIHGLNKFKKLRHEEDFSFSSGDADAPANPGAQLNELITEGSSVGMHILTSVDTFNNVNRAMSRKALTEFEMRVVFQMSANDSASLIESPKASALGLHRALFYNEQEGHLETFRPYALPDTGWIAEAAAKLAQR